MELFKQRKGITPVIAIVLLLMVTVGAVGVVYTQFNSLVGNPNEELRQQQRDQDTRIRISRVESNASVSNSLTGAERNAHNVSDYGTLMMTIQNSGSVSRNTSTFVLTALSGETTGEYSLNNQTCFHPANSTILDPQGSYYCNTGITFPKVTEEVRLEVLLTGSSKTWTTTCQPRQSGADVC